MPGGHAVTAVVPRPAGGCFLCPSCPIRRDDGRIASCIIPLVPQFDDLFHVFRWLLSIVAGVYATVITAQSLWGWYVWLAGPDKYTSMLRRYVIVHGLRLRVRAFWGDVLVCIGLCVIFLLLWRAHVMMDAIGR